MRLRQAGVFVLPKKGGGKTVVRTEQRPTQGQHGEKPKTLEGGTWQLKITK